MRRIISAKTIPTALFGGILMFWGAISAGAAETTLVWDFESPEECRVSLKALRGKGQQKAEFSTAQASSGKGSLHVVFPAYSEGIKGTDKWRYARLFLPTGMPSDWSDYRQMQVDVLNPMPDKQILGIAPTGPKFLRANRQLIAPGDWTTITLDLAPFARKLPNGMTEVNGLAFEVLLHLKRLDYPTEFYIDNIRLVPKNLDAPESVSLRVIQPRFQGNLYASHPLTEGIVGVKLNVAKSVLPNLQGAVRVVAKPAGRVLAEQPLRATLEEQTLDFDLPADARVFEVTATVSDQRTGYERTLTENIRRMPPNEDEVVIDENDNLLVNGRPFFPIGIFFHYSNGVAELDYVADKGFNSIGPYHRPEPELVEAARRHNLRMLPSAGGQFVEENSPYDIGELSDSGRFMGYYLYDEPHPYNAPREQVKARVEAYRQADPYHPATFLCNNDQNFYAGIPDAMLIDSYSLPGPFGQLRSRVSAGMKAMEGKGPIWFVPQIFAQWSYCRGGTLQDGRPLTFDELRAETWMGVALGAKGIFYYNYHLTAPDVMLRIANPDVWEAVGHVNEELSALSEAVLSPEEADLELLEAPDLFCAKAKVVGGHTVIVAVNGAQEAADVRLKVASLGTTQLHLFGENRAIDTRDGVIEDRFASQTCNVYTTDAALAASVPVAKHREEINARQAAREVRGRRNLARMDHGIELSASWEFPELYRKDDHGFAGATEWNLMVDGNRGTKWTIGRAGTGRYVWPDDLIYRGERWIEVSWPEAVKIGRANVVTTPDLKYDLALWTDGQWQVVQPVGEESSSDYHYRLEARTAKYDLGTVKTSRLRLLLTKETNRAAAIFEIECYAPGPE